MTQAQPGSGVVERSRVRVEAAPGRTKLVTVPVDGGPVPMGMHGGVAEHYQVSPDQAEPHATTLDYLVGATTGCLTGSFGGRLAALGQSTDGGRLIADGAGEIVNDGGVLRVAAITVRYRLRLDPGVPDDQVHRAHERHRGYCPMAHSIGGSVDIRTELEIIRD